MAKKRTPELKVEFINDGKAHHFISLLEYKRENYLCIIDFISPTEIGAYVLDYAEQEEIPVADFLRLVTQWFYGKSDSHPLSIELARHGLTSAFAPIYRTFDATYVSRIVGQSFSYEGMQTSKVKRRRVIPVPEGIEIRFRKD